MANLEQITSKIKQDSENQKEAILKEAKLECEKIIEILKKAETESIDRKSRILSSAELKIRNEKLQVKQKVMDSIFLKAKENLNSMSEIELKKFIKNKILSLDIVGDEKIILSKKNKDLLDLTFINEINKELLLKGKKGEISLSNIEREFNGGFILEKNGIEINMTFDSLVNASRDDVEFEIARILFS